MKYVGHSLYKYCWHLLDHSALIFYSSFTCNVVDHYPLVPTMQGLPIVLGRSFLIDFQIQSIECLQLVITECQLVLGNELCEVCVMHVI